MSATLFLTLKRKWFDAIASGSKTVEYREVKPHWESRIVGKDITRAVMRAGYSSTAPTMRANVTLIEQLDNGKDTDLKHDGPVFAIHLSDVEQQ